MTRAGGGRGAGLVALLVLLGAGPAAAGLELPAGFQAHVYVTGTGFDTSAERSLAGIPSTSTLAVDAAGSLYLARTGRRYVVVGEADSLWPIYRVPVGGARLTPAREGDFFFGPPLRNPQVGTLRGGRELYLTTYDNERKIGVVYRVHDPRHLELFAGGTPPPGQTPLLRQPEGMAFDGAGRLYVADRAQGAILRLDLEGRVLDPRFFVVPRPRLLAMGAGDRLWVAADGEAEAPWQRGPGELWRVAADGSGERVARGPVASGISVGPGDVLFVADRQAARIVAFGPDGRQVPLARFTDGDAPRSLTFVPDTPATQEAGIAGDLLVVVLARGAWPLNEVIRVSGPFRALVEPLAAPR